MRKGILTVAATLGLLLAPAGSIAGSGEGHGYGQAAKACQQVRGLLGNEDFKTAFGNFGNCIKLAILD